MSLPVRPLCDSQPSPGTAHAPPVETNLHAPQNQSPKYSLSAPEKATISQSLGCSLIVSSPPISSQLLTSVSTSSCKIKMVLPEEFPTKAAESEVVQDSHISLNSLTHFSTVHPGTSESACLEIIAGSLVASSPVTQPLLKSTCENDPIPTKAGSNELAEIRAIESYIAPDAVITLESPTSTVSVMVETRTQKRVRQGEPDEGGLPPKRPATKPKGKPKPTPKAKSKGKGKATAKTAPDEIVTSTKDELGENDDELPEKPKAKANSRRRKSPPTNDDDSDSSSAFEKVVARPIASLTPTTKQPSPNHTVPIANNEDEPAIPEQTTSILPLKPKAKRSYKKTIRAAPPPSTRPSRTRKAPERFETFESSQPAKPTPSSKPTSKVFDPMYMTTNSASRLAKADIYHLLLEPRSWTTLSATQQMKLISMLPSSPGNDALLAKIRVIAGQSDGTDQSKREEEGEGEAEQQGQGGNDTRPRAFTFNNDCFRTDVAKFQEDLKNGHLAKTWLVSAEKAVIERAEGRFDEWKKEEAERWWGQKGR